MVSPFEKLAADLARTFTKNQHTLVTAESCTGGGLAYYLTELPGSSAWFERGFITYSNLAKQELLSVQAATLEQFGAVSAETAAEMAIGALKNSNASISIAITGIAGPDGGSIDKPIGTVWLGWSLRHGKTDVKLNSFTGNRQQIRQQAIMAALEQLLKLHH